jgi:sporulation protein YqfC
MKRSKRKKKEPKDPALTTGEKLSQWLQMPLDAVMNLPHIEMTGNREILVENCKGIAEYGQEEIRILGGRTILRITGKRLVLKAMTDDSILVGGEITLMEFIG